MSTLFSSPKMPAMAPLPGTPLQDEAQKRERDVIARQAAIDLATSGRRTTEFAGRSLALSEQKDRINKRASQELGG